MLRMRFIHSLLLIGLFSIPVYRPGLVTAHSRASSDAPATPQVYDGIAVDYDINSTEDTVSLCGHLGKETFPYKLQITQFTPDREMGLYKELLQSQGQSAFMDALKSTRGIGQLTFDGKSHDIRFARETIRDNKPVITILLDRLIDTTESTCGVATSDYLFTYINIEVNDKGQADGVLYANARLRFNKDQPNGIAVDDFGAYPIRLTSPVPTPAGSTPTF